MKNMKVTSFQKAAIFIVLVAAGLYWSKGFFVSAMVNGQPISRFSVLSQLEKMQGQQVIDNKVTEILIAQEAKKRGIKVTDEDLQAEVDRINTQLTAQGQSLETALTGQGMTMADLKAQLKLQLLLTKMVEANIQISSDDIDKFIAENGSYFPTDLDENGKRDFALTQLKQQKQGEQVQGFLEDLRTKADIKLFN